MNKKLLKKIFPLLVLLLLTPWPIAYAYDVSGTEAGQETVQIEIAEASAQPTWTVFGNAIGGVETGDLFYVDATGNAADTVVTLHLTNASELVHNYRYLTLKVGVYVETDEGEWEKAAQWNGEPIPDTFITMRNGQVSFTLVGLAKYKVAIDGGSFNSFTGNAEEGSLSPQFFLTVDQA